MGSSEGNTHTLWSARNYLSGSGMQKKDEMSSNSSPFDVLRKEPVVSFPRAVILAYQDCAILLILLQHLMKRVARNIPIIIHLEGNGR